ncbi:hypothetical protein LTS08_001865 [Lithohypha guttulata]|nr:hypothetical protein LTS08_001865 [Lithohypha guttulata]
MATSKVVLVTGASRGIGQAIARFLIEAPPQHKLVLTARTSQPLEELKSLAPDRVDYVAGDISDAAVIEKAVNTAVRKFGGLDGLILNHGTLGHVKSISELSMTDWQEDFTTNFFSAAYAAKVAIPELRKTKGRIVITSSGAAQGAYRGWAVYGASKAAQNHLCLSLRAEEADITTIAIRPGMVDTDMQRTIREQHVENMDAEDMKKFQGAFDEGKLVKPEQCGHVIAKLAIAATPDLSGMFLSWNDERLTDYQLRK